MSKSGRGKPYLRVLKTCERFNGFFMVFIFALKKQKDKWLLATLLENSITHRGHSINGCGISRRQKRKFFEISSSFSDERINILDFVSPLRICIYIFFMWISSYGELRIVFVCFRLQNKGQNPNTNNLYSDWFLVELRRKTTHPGERRHIPSK